MCVSGVCHSLRFYVGEDEIVGLVYTGSLSQRAGGVCLSNIAVSGRLDVLKPISLHHPRKEEWLACLKWRLVLV